MLTGTLMSLGILKLPGTEQKLFKNAYGIEIDFQWWPIVSSILSLIGILFGTLWMFDPIVKETNKIVGYFTFIPIFLFRFKIWFKFVECMISNFYKWQRLSHSK